MTWLNKIKFSGTDLSKKKSLVGLSFDDGPNEKYTLGILEILKKFKVQATFFWIVENAVQLKNKKPDIFEKIVSEIKNDRHEIGLHAPYDYKPTFWNRLLGKFTKQEMEESKRTIEKLTGLFVQLYRPHYLQFGRSISFANELGMTTILGDFIHYTNADVKREIQIKKFSNVNHGGILVFHDGTSMKTKKNNIIEVLPVVLKNLNRKGMHGTKISSIL